MPPASGPLPRRSLPSSAVVPDTKKELAALRKRVAGKPEKHFPHTFAAIFQTGLEVETAAETPSDEAFGQVPVTLPSRAFGEARREALALVSDPSRNAIAFAELDTLALAEAMARHTRRAFITAVADVRGLVHAIRVAALANRLRTDSNRGYPNEVFFAPGHRYQHFDERAAVALRHVVCSADETTYERALAEARAWRDALGAPAPFDPTDYAAATAEHNRGHARAFFAVAFPDSTFASEEVAAAIAADLAPPTILLASLSSIDDVRAVLAHRGVSLCAAHLHDLAAALPEADTVALFEEMLPALLKKPRHGPLLKTPPRELVRAAATLRDEAAWAFLARHASDPVVGSAVLELFRAHPERGGSLEAASKGHTKLAATAERVLGSADDSRAIAASTSFPDYLRTRPWLAKPKRKTKPTVLELPILGDERAFVDRSLLPTVSASDAPPLEGDAHEAFWARVANRNVVFVHGGPVVEHDRRQFTISRDELAKLAGHDPLYVADPLAFVAALGLDALPRFVRDWTRELDYEGAAATYAAAKALVSPRMAVPMARAAAKKSWRSHSLAWFVAHADVVVPGLLPAALGSDTKLRCVCEDVLLHLRDHGHLETIRRAAQALGPDAASAIDLLLAHDPIHAPAKPPKRPSYLRVEALPAPRTTAGERLPGEAVEGLLDLLSLGHADAPHPGVRALTTDPRLDAASFAIFARELFEQWVIGDAPGKDEWMLHACVAFPNATTTARVGAFAREQARKNAAKAERACRALAALGSDHALSVLELVALTSRYGALVDLATTLRANVAVTRGLDEDELADRTLPDAGLDSRGIGALVRGETTWQARLFPDLKLHLRESDDAPWRTTPSRRKGGPELDALREAFAGLRADVQLAVDLARRRFERALRDERRWSVEAFERHVLRHPVAQALACTLLWESVTSRVVTFRVAEDGTLADVDEATFVLPRDGHVRLAHPARGIDAAWSQQFVDYGITQPFEQLGRRVDVGMDRASVLATALAGAEVSPRRVLGTLEPRGWNRVARSTVSVWERRVPAPEGPVELRWVFDPEVWIVDVRRVPKMATTSFFVGREPLTEASLERLGALARFELRRDLEAIGL
ncbi:MAG: DUF4132 domain-containing protein [Sandaracinus sp.]|nr:DUF4132 domain-containing protein [Sandaracinus sp.]